MPQASLREYFLKHYKGGSVLKHDAYEHDAEDWCWIHKSSGIKARPARFDAFRHATLWRSRLAPTPQQQLLAGLAGCPRPHPVWWKWRSALLLPLYDSSRVSEHHGSKQESRWSLRDALSHQSTCHVMSCVFVPAHLPDGHSLEHPKASLLTSGPKANAWWGQGKVSRACACITTDKTWAIADLCVHCKHLWWGVYSVRRAPDEWPDVATLVDNNYRNMHARDVKTKGREAADEESVPFLGAAFLVHIFGSIFGCGHRQCLEINTPRSSHAGVRLPCRLLYSTLGKLCHLLRCCGWTDAGDAEGGW